MELDIGVKGGSIMRKSENDLDMPIGKLTRVEDYLPPPEKLVVPERTVKVTLRISESSMKFFKRAAKRNHTKYQKMIRVLLDKYAKKYLIQH